MGIAEFLDAPDSALLIAIDGDVNLVTTHHETETRTIIDRFPLGPVANVDAVLALLGMQGLLQTQTIAPVAPALPEKQQPALPAPQSDRPYVCDDCGKGFGDRWNLKRHRTRMHGVADAEQLPGESSEFRCPECPQSFVKKRALGMHRLRMHGVHAKPRRKPITGEHACPDCDARFETPLTLSMHQMKVHRIQPPPALMAVTAPASQAAPENQNPPATPEVATEVACDLCNRTFKSQHALSVHKARAHTGSTWSTRPKADKPQELPEPASEPIVATAPSIPSIDDVPPVHHRKAAVLADGSCPVCHEPLLTHEKCEGCGVLVGPGHETERSIFITGADYCRDCARGRIAARKAELAAHAS